MSSISQINVTNTGINGTSIYMLKGKPLPVNTTKTLKELDINYREFLEHYLNPFSTINDLVRQGVLVVDVVNSKITTVYGPMFSGKSKKVLDLIEGRDALLFRTEFDKGDISGINITEFVIRDPYEILVNVDKGYVVYLEGIHLYDAGTFKIVLNKLIKDGYEVICSGIDLSWKGDPFISTKTAIESGSSIQCLALCSVCQKPAEYTTKLQNTDDIMAQYEPRCEEHFDGKLK